MVIMPVVVKGEETQSLEKKATPNEKEADSNKAVKEVRPFLLKGLWNTQVLQVTYSLDTGEQGWRSDPLRRLARKGELFLWGEEQEKSFLKLKSQVASAPVLAYFDKDSCTRFIADASPVGLGAVLVQEKNGDSRAGRLLCKP
ncbi:hypothetical protein ACROYT_G008271 [Oculina patagonica]